MAKGFFSATTVTLKSDSCRGLRVNVITFRTLVHLGQSLHKGLTHRPNFTMRRFSQSIQMLKHLNVDVYYNNNALAETNDRIGLY